MIDLEAQPVLSFVCLAGQDRICHTTPFEGTQQNNGLVDVVVAVLALVLGKIHVTKM